MGIRKTLKKIPLLVTTYRALNNWRTRSHYKSKKPDEVFKEIYEKNSWGGKDSVSGTGSDVYQTRIIIQELPKLFKKTSSKSILDVPCGDFNWMKEIVLSNINYIGADIVEKLIQRNNEMYANEHIRFLNLNLIKDNLPNVDLILCRDCLVHFSYEDIFLALNNICNSGAEYLLTTTFTERKRNINIVTGQWRVLNLQAPPFNLPNPIQVIIEGCTEGNGDCDDKALGLWKIADIKMCLTKDKKTF